MTVGHIPRAYEPISMSICAWLLPDSLGLMMAVQELTAKPCGMLKLPSDTAKPTGTPWTCDRRIRHRRAWVGSAHGATGDADQHGQVQLTHGRDADGGSVVHADVEGNVQR